MRSNWKHDWTDVVRNAIEHIESCKNFSELAKVLGTDRRGLQYHCAKFVKVHDGERVFDAFKRAVVNGEIAGDVSVPEKVPECGTGYCHWCGEKVDGKSQIYCGEICSQKFLNLHRGERPKWTAWNEHFFDDLTPNGAYILGFIVADGHIRNSMSGRGTRQYVIEIHQKDSRVLKRIAKTLDFEGILTGSGNSPCARLALGSKHAWEILTEVYEIPAGKRKSYEAAMPSIILENEKCLPHFIRGLFDGDGHVDKKYAHFGLSSGSKKLVEDFNRVLSGTVGLSSREKEWREGSYDKVDGTRSGCWYIRWVSEEDCKRFAQYIYGSNLDVYGSDLYLRYKKKHLTRFFQERAEYWNLGLGL